MDAAPQPKRKHPAHLLPLEAGNRSIIIFLTVCTRVADRFWLRMKFIAGWWLSGTKRIIGWSAAM